jgi:hypothetical protein
MLVGFVRVDGEDECRNCNLAPDGLHAKDHVSIYALIVLWAVVE